MILYINQLIFLKRRRNSILLFLQEQLYFLEIIYYNLIKNNILLKNNNTINKITIKIYEGNEKLDEDNMYLEEFIINIYKYKKEIIVKISMIMEKI